MKIVAIAGSDVLSIVESSICIKIAVANIIGSTRFVASIFFDGKCCGMAKLVCFDDITFGIFKLPYQAKY